MMAQEEFSKANKTANHLISQAITQGENNEDFMEENPSYDFRNSVDDLDRIISKVKDMRPSFREKDNELRIHFEEHPDRGGDVFGKAYNNTLGIVKEYLLEARKKESHWEI